MQTRSTTRQESDRNLNTTSIGLNNQDEIATYIQASINIQQQQLVEQLTSHL